MNPLYLHIPTFLTMVWAWYVKFRQKRYGDLCLLALLMVASAINEIIVYEMVLGDISVSLHMLQMGACSCILPLVYIFVHSHINSNVSGNRVITALWVLAALTFIPNVIVYNPLEPLVYPESGIKPFAFYILSHGEKMFAIYVGDLVVVLQALVLLVPLISFVHTMHLHRLSLSRKFYAFSGSVLLLIIFAIMLSTMDYAVLRSPAGKWFYFGAYNLMTIILNLFIVWGFDLAPVETQEGEKIEDVETYVQRQYSEMAGALRYMMEEEHLYCDPGITAERVIAKLQTNHTYFSEMMSQVMKQSFSDYLNDLRLARVTDLLRDEKVTIAAAAAQSGFTDAGYMTRRFKSRYGLTPTEWRKQAAVGTEKNAI